FVGAFATLGPVRWLLHLARFVDLRLSIGSTNPDVPEMESGLSPRSRVGYAPRSLAPKLRRRWMACTTGGSVRDAPELEVDLRILLIQIRDHGDVMADHEFECVQR